MTLGSSWKQALAEQGRASKARESAEERRRRLIETDILCLPHRVAVATGKGLSSFQVMTSWLTVEDIAESRITIFLMELHSRNDPQYSVPSTAFSKSGPVRALVEACEREELGCFVVESRGQWANNQPSYYLHARPR